MGMDVFGKKPSAEVGEYFRNNAWWWRPLAGFVCERYPAIASACTYWGSNDGDGLDAAGAVALADALEADLASGYVQSWADQYEATLAALPMEPCTLCGGTGARTDEVGQSHGLDKPGGCNGCGGRGECEPWARAYPFSVENVAEFAAFCRASGGFEIW